VHPLKRKSDGSPVLVRVKPDSSRVEFPVTFCFFCGGHLDGGLATADGSASICPCIKSHAQDPSCSVHWEARLQEFSFLVETDVKRHFFLMRFCPWCGTRLPRSRRFLQVTRMSEVDADAIEERLRGVTTAAEVIARLGEPDRTLPGWTPDPDRKKLYGMKKVVRVLNYYRLSPTVRIAVQEYEDGSIHIDYSGQLIRTS
jgi:hypothetical protein